MRFLFFTHLAALNLWRRPSRTCLILVLISVGLCGLLFLQGFYAGMVTDLVQNAILKDCGHIILQNTKFKHGRELKHSLDEDKILRKIQSLPPSVQPVSRILCDGIAASAGRQRPIVLIGLHSQRESGVTELDRSLIEGKFSIEEGQALIGKDLADKLDLEPGNKLIVKAQNQKQEIISAAFRVQGILKAHNPGIDLLSVFIPISQAQNLLEMTGKTTQINLFLSDPQDMNTLRDQLKTELGKTVRVDTWQQLYPGFAMAENALEIVNLICCIIVFLAVGMGIFDVILVSILERVREFGILLSLGTPFDWIRHLIFMEGLIMGVLGFFLGSVAATVLLLYFQQNPIDLGIFGNGLSDFGMIPNLRPDLRPRYFLISSAFLLLVVLITTAVPLKILRKLNPVQSIHFV